MSKAKFTYDEKGATFFYFVLSILAPILCSSTYYLWPSKTQEDGKKIDCRCNGCASKQQQLDSLHKWKRSRQKLVRGIIVIGWVAFVLIAYKCATTQHEYVNFDPFEILGISENATPNDIKKAYRRLSLIYHPDKGSHDPDKFVKITKAYAALTDEEARKNWEQHGNPDGPGATQFGIALPSWIVEKENSFFVLGIYGLILGVLLPVSVGIWWYRSVKYGNDKVLINTTEVYYYFIHKTPNMAMKRVIMILSASLEFAKTHNPEVIERPTDNQEIPRLMRDLNLMGEKNTEPPLNFSYSIKTKAILHAHLSRIKLPPNTLEIDRRLIVQKCPYLLQEFVHCIAQLITLALSGRITNMPNLATLENAMKLGPLIVQALWEYQSPLLQLPHFNKDTLRHLERKKIKINCTEQLARMKENERRDALRNFTDAQYEDVKLVLGSMPLIQVKCKFEVLDDEDPGVITAGSIVTAVVKLKRRQLKDLFDKENTEITSGDGNVSDVEEDWDKKFQEKVIKKQKVFESKPKKSHPVHCPYFPDDKQEFWWVYIVDRKRFALVTAPLLVTNLVDTEEVELKFTAPNTGVYSYTIVVRSDSYVDSTVQKQARIDVKPAREYVEADYDIPEDDIDEDGEDEHSSVEDSDLLTDTDDD
jgi:translocation protein SEC63